MNLCSDGHDEVCYETRHCPACELKDELSSLSDDLDNLNLVCDELRDEIQELQNG